MSLDKEDFTEVDLDDDSDSEEPHESGKTSISSEREPKDEDVDSSTQKDELPSGFSAKWTRAINHIRQPVMRGLQFLTSMAARNPKMTIGVVVMLSVALLVIGFFTGFRLEDDEDILWTPKGSKTIQHREWIDDDSGFPNDQTRFFAMFFHSQGENALDYERVEHISEALDAIRDMDGYDEMCAKGIYVDSSNNVTTCKVHGVTKFWTDKTEIFLDQTPEQALITMSGPYYPDGVMVAETDIYGCPIRGVDSNLTSVESYMVGIEFPDMDEAEDFEEKALNVIINLDDQWQAEPNINFRVEVTAYRSFTDEYNRAIVGDIPLVPIVFIVMSIFTMAVFFRRDKVYSRSFLGFCGVVSVLLSLASGYGLMFVCGVPLTSITQILPFIMFGIGLDDVFIITGSYDRTDPMKDPVARIHDTIEDVGLSITLTSITSSLAFALGCSSTIPAVFWLCLYGVPTIVLVFLYQLTFFVACIVLDQRRILQKHRDPFFCCFCINTNVDEEDEPESESSETRRNKNEVFAVRAMGWYAKRLLLPRVKAAVVLCFLVLAGFCAYSASQLIVSFKFVDVLPSDSYLTDFVEAFDEYTETTEIWMGVYFRDVDQSNSAIQQQMENYVADLATIDATEQPPDYFWLTDFKSFVSESNSTIRDLAFNDQIELFLSESVYSELYRDHIVRDDTGSVTASRCALKMGNLDLEDVNSQINALEDQRDVTKAQEINKGRKNWAFFSYNANYSMWEFYAVSVDELIFTTIIGIVAVTGVALFFIPHYTAAMFVFPLITVLYVDLLGCLQWAGVEINPVSYVSLVMSIGLLVDYVMHILLRYYESAGNREEKIMSTLRTMGSSILIGGISSLLGTLPLAFTSSNIFQTVFYTFLCLVTLGCGHGLILLPVILATIGPEGPPVNQQPMKSTRRAETCGSESV